ncbi:DUF7426 family protein [Corynebacterium ulcerans]|uniref:DUF7426 family protein n=1 Tax=Corynebacterium ulcerans TaxID=65058 RepID=UPI0002141BBC|nr:hypothetical protein [Corynebacterium ulcerans]AEG84390.1 hypothetical protein CULC22_01680 [Corynebacterium ulcerans BR-AD22]
MANLGELYDFLTPEDISLTINGVEYRIEPSADVVLRFIADYNDLESFDDKTIAKISAPLVGAQWSEEDGFTGGLPEEMKKAGVPEGVIARVVVTAMLFYKFDEETATDYYQHGDLGKALKEWNLRMEKAVTEAFAETA